MKEYNKILEELLQDRLKYKKSKYSNSKWLGGKVESYGKFASNFDFSSLYPSSFGSFESVSEKKRKERKKKLERIFNGNN